MRGTPVTRGEEYLGLQMSLLQSAKKPAPPREAPEETGGTLGHTLVHFLCPRCRRYLGSALAGASALCPRCGVWSQGS